MDPTVPQTVAGLACQNCRQPLKIKYGTGGSSGVAHIRYDILHEAEHGGPIARWQIHCNGCTPDLCDDCYWFDVEAIHEDPSWIGHMESKPWINRTDWYRIANQVGR